MKPPAIRRFHSSSDQRSRERGVTMALVAIAMVAIIAMAALSIDLVTLFLAREETQRSADAGALAAARVLSVSGMTGDTTSSPTTWACICGTGCATTSAEGGLGFATLAAQSAAGQSTISGAGGNSSASIFSVNVTYSASGSSNPDCTKLAAAGVFGVNPIVNVQVIRSNLPTFFSSIWGNSGNTVNVTASAEAFNPSFSATYSNSGTTGTIIPVQPRCVKPWIVPNQDPLNPEPSTNGGYYCNHFGGSSCTTLVGPTDGSITHTGVSLDGSGTTGVIGEQFLLIPACSNGTSGGACTPYTGHHGAIEVEANHRLNGAVIPSQPNLEYLPGQTLNSSVAVPSSALGSGSLYEQAIDGCDQTTKYQCGVPSSSASPQNMVDLSENPAYPTGDGDSMNGVMALIHQGSSDTGTQPSGQDYFSPNYGVLTSTPFQIVAGSSNPITGTSFPSGSAISASTSIVSLPIYDSTNNTIANNGSTSPVTIVGFLQVFVNAVDQYGNVNVTVLNVAGCSNGSGGNVGTAVTGSSPVPIRLITPPAPPPQ
jgi:Flp pilus assembly protein TadG